jgi:hypothetical protein
VGQARRKRPEDTFSKEVQQCIHRQPPKGRQKIIGRPLFCVARSDTRIEDILVSLTRIANKTSKFGTISLNGCRILDEHYQNNAGITKLMRIQIIKVLQKTAACGFLLCQTKVIP